MLELFYFELVRMFGNIPLITANLNSDYYKVLQASPVDVYKQIEKDLVEAIPDLPMTLDHDNEGA